MKKLMNIVMAALIVISLGNNTAFASEKPDKNSPIKAAVVTKDDSLLSNAESKFKEKYPGKYSEWESTKSPNGTIYKVFEVANIDYDLEELSNGTVNLKIYMLALKPGAKEFEVTEITDWFVFKQKACYDKIKIFAPTDDRVLITYYNYTIEKNSRNNYDMIFSENHGLLIDSTSNKMLKDIDGGIDKFGYPNNWKTTTSNAYTVEDASEKRDELNPKSSFKPGEVRAYSLKDGSRNVNFKI